MTDAPVRPYLDGLDAFKARIPLRACPYRKRSVAWKRWREGWLCAERLYADPIDQPNAGGSRSMDDRPNTTYRCNGVYVPPAAMLPHYPRRRAWFTVASCGVWFIAAVISALIFGAVRTW